MIAGNKADQVGLVKMLLRRSKTLNALMSRRPKEELGEVLGVDTLMESTVYQLVFSGLTVEPASDYYSRKIFQFDIFDYAVKPKKIGSVAFRVFYPTNGSSGKRSHRRIENIIWKGEELYAADGL